MDADSQAVKAFMLGLALGPLITPDSPLPVAIVGEPFHADEHSSIVVETKSRRRFRLSVEVLSVPDHLNEPPC